ncbi:MAG: rRNA maturation RNase YbeY [Chloroflexi bacterium]|nr:rRNA maturation RNase YbeY [Chloroflexota bacterium]
MTARSVYLAPWRIDVEVRPGTPRIVPVSALARCLAGAVAAGGAPRPAAAGLILADDAELARLNAAHMGTEGATDVLSFPLLPAAAFPPHPGGGRHAAAGPLEPPFRLPPRVRRNLGDVVVSVERAIAQARDGRGGQSGDMRWSAADELRLLVVHGGLHLCGWDHAEPEEGTAMRALERTLLGNTHGGGPARGGPAGGGPDAG